MFVACYRIGNLPSLRNPTKGLCASLRTVAHRSGGVSMSATMQEQWNPVSGYEGWYEVSNLGNVRSVDRIVFHHRTGSAKWKGKRLFQKANRNGYIMVTLVRQRKRMTFTVHKLVADAFIPNPRGVLYVDHVDGNRQNNRLDNLERVTMLENNQRARAKGRLPVGERVWTAKLTSAQVVEIRRKYKDGATPSALSQEYGIDASHIGKIGRGEKWRHIKDNENTMAIIQTRRQLSLGF